MSTETDTRAFQQAVADLDNLADSVPGLDGIDGASCPPDVMYLAKVGIGAAYRGCSAEGWRAEVTKVSGPHIAQDLEHAEQCMRKSGLWPWPGS